MLDLKAKLAAAGLVSAADIAAAERKPARPSSPEGKGPKASPGESTNQGGPRNQNQPGPRNQNQPGPRNQSGPRNQPHKPANKPRPLLDVAALQRGNKGEAYDAIRRVVEQGRLDPAHGIPGEQAEAFHFSTAAGQLSRLTLEPEARAALTDGRAGLVAFMSHHGLAHCVVPRPLAEAIHDIFPLWLRVLKDHPGAGQSTPRPEPAQSTPPAPAPATPPAAEADPAPPE